MALDTMIKNLATARDNYNKTLESLGKDAAAEIAKALASAIPEGQALQWTQYTDYFNDGESCTFGVHDAELGTASEPDDDGVRNVKGFAWGDAEYKLSAELSAIWRSLPEDMMLTAFGDHTKVTVFQDGTYTNDEYDHN